MDTSVDLYVKMANLEDVPKLEKVGDQLFDYPIKQDRAEEFLNDPRHHMAIGVLNGKVVAFASGFHYVHPDKEPDFFIAEVNVLETYRNKGIARSIVKFLCDYAKNAGFHEAWIATEESNIAARKAYLASGGKEDPEKAIVFTFKLDD